MIKGIGTDIVDIDRIAESIRKHGDRFAQKILSQEEFELYSLHIAPAQYLASRFAAKEAAAKALGTGFREGLYLHHISITNDALGKPVLHYSDKALTLIESLDVQNSWISIAHEKHYAVAFVVLT